MSKSGSYIGGHTILHKGSPFFYKTNPHYLSKRHKQKNYLKDIENQLSNVQILMESYKEFKKKKLSRKKRKKLGINNVYEGNLYYWLIAIFKTLRQRHTKLRNYPEIEKTVSDILLEMGVRHRLLKKVIAKIGCPRCYGSGFIKVVSTPDLVEYQCPQCNFNTLNKTNKENK